MLLNRLTHRGTLFVIQLTIPIFVELLHELLTTGMTLTARAMTTATLFLAMSAALLATSLDKLLHLGFLLLIELAILVCVKLLHKVLAVDTTLALPPTVPAPVALTIVLGALLLRSRHTCGGAIGGILLRHQRQRSQHADQ